MANHHLIAELSLGVSLTLLWMLTVAFKAYREDNLRDQLFALRDEMFLYAYDCGLLESPCHKNLRILMNSLIRYAHRVSFFRLLLWGAAMRLTGVKLPESKSYKQWKDSLEGLPEAECKRFLQFHQDAGLLVIKHMIAGSPLLWAVGLAIGVSLAISRTRTMLFDRTAEMIRGHVPSIDLLEAEAMRAIGSA